MSTPGETETKTVEQVMLGELSKLIRTTSGTGRARAVLDSAWQAVATLYGDEAERGSLGSQPKVTVDDLGELLGIGVALAAAEALVDIADALHTQPSVS